MVLIKKNITFLTFVALTFVTAACLAEEVTSGAAVYKEKCASCHEAVRAKAPSLVSLSEMSAENLSAALTDGTMKTQGDLLQEGEKEALVAWLTRDQVSEVNWEERATCSNPTVNLISHKNGNVAHVGYGIENLRHQVHTTITPENVSSLQLDSVIAFPGATEMRAQPALIGGTLFLGVREANTLYAFDAKKMCIKWTFKTEEPFRSAVGYGLVEGRDIIFFGAGKTVHVLDPLTGQEIWSHSDHYFALLTAPPILNGKTLFVAASSWEMIAGMDPNYECCRTSGSVTAMKALTGEVLWSTNTTAPATPQRKSSVGTQIWGPSGAPIWGAPTIDEKRGLLYVGTGENYTRPTTETSDAILALDLETGVIKWAFQGTADDAYNAACLYWMGLPNGPSCPENSGKDLDFGASVMLVSDANGRDLLIAGQKSGMVYALDPDGDGEVIWKTQLSDGNLMGGVHWDMSAMDGKIFVGISDPALPIENYTPRPGLSALDVTTGEVLWHYRAMPSCTFSPEANAKAKAAGERSDCPSGFGFSAGITTVPGLVFTGGLDGQMRAHAADTGEVLWQANTAVPHVSDNGPAGHGGAIDNNTVVIRDGTLYVQSGYGQFMDQLPGNVLLTYKLAKE